MPSLSLSSRWKPAIFMISLHAFFAGCFYLLDRHYLNSIFLQSTWSAYLYALLFIVTIFQYLYTAASNPGYVADFLKEDQIAEIERENSKLSSSIRICQTCRVFQPPRSYHSVECNKCVLRYDHYCGWLGTCVGYGNHCKFWWYIFDETGLCLWTTIVIISSVKHHQSSSWLQRTALFSLLILLLLLLFLLFMLLIFHSYLIITNQTSHELVRRKRIPELRDLPMNVKPYSQGFRRNIYSFCCIQGTVYEIERTRPSDILEEVSKHSFCERFYFHCC